MSRNIRIALDAMGGDRGPVVVVSAAVAIACEYPDIQLILVGDRAVVIEHLKLVSTKTFNNIKIVHASEQVLMDELPSQALRNKKDSSMRVAINLVKEKKANACVSAGNTGALMATARFVLKTLPGIDRPGILASLPTKIPNRSVRMVDLGANIDCTAEHLFQFAVMSSIATAAVAGIEQPSVALLNIGEEEIKGNEQVKQAAAMLVDLPSINYRGYVEANDFCKGEVDLIVCDGFVGNVALKAIEGSARLVRSYIKAAFEKNWLSKLAGLISLPVLKQIRRDVDPARYNGASFLGLQGIVIKSHGNASALGFKYAILEAIEEAKHNVPDLIKDRVGEMLSQRSES